MKTALLCLLLAVPVFAQNEPSLQEKVTRFKEAESRAPRGYPTLFVVSSASSQSGGLIGGDQACEMYIATLGRTYFVTATQGLVSACKIFPPGTTIFGRVREALLGKMVDLFDATESKPKKRTYLVKDMNLVDPANQ